MSREKGTVLLTGSTGFLGRSLTERLREMGYKTIGLLLERNRPDNSTLSANQNSFFSKIDQLDKLENLKEVKAIIHLATDYGKESNEMVEFCNYQFPKKLMELSFNHKIKTFLSADSFFCDLPDSYPYLDEYRYWKLKFRDFAIKYSKDMDLCFANLKIFHMYGPFDSKDKFITEIFFRMKGNEEKINLTDCQQRRDFIYLRDVVSAFEIVLINKAKLNTGFNNFDVGTGDQVRLKDFLVTLKTKLGSESILNFGALEQRHKEEYIEKIKANNESLYQLGWKVRANYKDGLTNLIELEKKGER